MNPFASRLSTNNWVVPVAAMGFILGILLHVTWITERTRSGRLNALDADQAKRIGTGPIDLASELQHVSQEVARLREENTKLQNAMSNTTGQTKVLNEGLQEAKEFAGLTDIEGPGIMVTLRDAAGAQSGNQIIHDVDVLKVVNELWAASAEAISVNGHRIVGRSSFRCVGPVIHVDNVPISSPVVIRAIGDSGTLRGALTLPLGVLAEIRSTGDPSMVSLENVDKQILPAYTGGTARKYGRTPVERKK
jgi:uncharacterized protein YlxW (UPF0749 family)